ncbi:MAG: hypothetical protein Q8N99_09075 [Nanoarchaeota archaeon]|nr:hypothetical protein [Nanoarchaeota archaeon]
MGLQTQVTEEELNEVFADTLDKGASFCGILVSYREDEQTRTELGIPYSLIGGELEIGPYVKNIVTSPPTDYHTRKKRIPISDIQEYRRVEFSNIL